MTKSANFAAIDLGAESGRVVLAKIDNDKLELIEQHRFSNGPVRTIDELHWDALRLWTQMKRGVAQAAQQDGELHGIGIDTWGVDFALLGKDDTMLGNPFHYRDARTNGIFDKAFKIVPREEIFDQTGIQFMQFNTIFQLLAMKLGGSGSALLDSAETLLMMPDIFNFWFTGRKCCEFTDATTTQLYNPRTGGWAMELIDKLDLPGKIFTEIVPAGTVLGSLRKDVSEEMGLGDVPMIAPATHDTGAAVAAVPATDGRAWVFISSGTWSLMGAEVKTPIIDEQSLKFNYTNEGGLDGTYRFLKNIMGLWLVQECRRTWARQGREYSYGELADLAAAAKPFTAIIDPDDSSFIALGDMPARIVDYCKKTKQAPPQGPGEMIRVCLEGLAMAYRQTLGRIEACTGQKAEVIHIVGGGIQNRHLCQWAADATGLPVVAGPIEATAAGNVAVQAVATGVLPDIKSAREVIRRSFDVVVYEPADRGKWDEPYKRFLQLRP